MAAPIGNQFWKLRSKHGCDKLFTTPELMWEAACEYFEWCDDNPLMATECYGKDAIIIEMPKMRAYTIQGICLYFGTTSSYLRNFKLEMTEDDRKRGFGAVIALIEEIIYNQKFTGAASGFFNPNIIARDLGLKEQTEISGKNIKVEIED